MIRIGGRACVVATAERLHNGSRLRFASGELLALPRSAVVTVVRRRAAHRRRHPLAQVVAGCVLVVALAVAVVAR